MIRGADVSKWQDPAKVDWIALRDHPDFRFLIARATYGARTADSRFEEFASAAREHGLVFGAYLFYRQTHTVEEQLALFDRQLDRIGGLKTDELFPVLDMEHNAVNGDGEPRPRHFSEACRKIAESWRDQYGGAILYYSSFFPEYLRARQEPALTVWMREDGYFHWLADYSRSVGNPRTPYTPLWVLHQPRPRPAPWYAGGSVDIDHDVVNPDVDFGDLLVDGAPTDVSDDARDGEQDTDGRPGGAFAAELDDGLETLQQGAQTTLEGLDLLRLALKGE